MPTFTTIGTNVLQRLGLMDPGSGASPSDLTYLRTICNEMLQGWSIERPLIFYIVEQSYSLTTTVGTYTIGLGGAFDTTPYGAPNRIESAYIKTGSQRNDLRIVNAQQYRNHNDLAAAASCPDEMYPDYSFSSGSLSNISFWPVPTFSGTLNVNVNFWAPLTQFTDLTTNIPFRDGYQNAIELNLMYLACLTAFGVGVDPTTKQQVSIDAPIAKQRIADLNRQNGLVPPDEPTGNPGKAIEQQAQR